MGYGIVLAFVIVAHGVEAAGRRRRSCGAGRRHLRRKMVVESSVLELFWYLCLGLRSSGGEHVKGYQSILSWIAGVVGGLVWLDQGGMTREGCVAG